MGVGVRGWGWGRVSARVRVRVRVVAERVQLLAEVGWAYKGMAIPRRAWLWL